MQRLLNIEWDAVSGVLATVTAVVLHFLHVIETDVLSMLTLVPDSGDTPDPLGGVDAPVLTRPGHGSALAAAGHAAGARDALYSDLSSSVVGVRTARTAGARQAATATPKTTTAAEASTVQSCGTTS